MTSALRVAIALILFSFCSYRDAARSEGSQVDVLLVLGADVSQSVDNAKFKLQREGYATAISDLRVIRAMTAGARGRIALSSSSGLLRINKMSSWIG